MSIIKKIKFDLPIDGVKVKNLEELREHFTVEILELYNNKMLLSWMRSRKMLEELDQLEKKASMELSRIALMKVFCEIFKIDADDMIIAAALGMPSEKIEKSFSEIKAKYHSVVHYEVKEIYDKKIIDLQREISQLHLNTNELDKLKQQVKAKNSQIAELKDSLKDQTIKVEKLNHQVYDLKENNQKLTSEVDETEREFSQYKKLTIVNNSPYDVRIAIHYNTPPNIWQTAYWLECSSREELDITTDIVRTVNRNIYVYVESDNGECYWSGETDVYVDGEIKGFTHINFEDYEYFKWGIN